LKERGTLFLLDLEKKSGIERKGVGKGKKKDCTKLQHRADD